MTHLMIIFSTISLRYLFYKLSYGFKSYNETGAILLPDLVICYLDTITVLLLRVLFAFSVISILSFVRSEPKY